VGRLGDVTSIAGMGHCRSRAPVLVTAKEVLEMGLARVVRFEGVGQDRIEEMRHGIEGEEAPEGLPAKEIVVLHDASRRQRS
jgi:hypothetical protein